VDINGRIIYKFDLKEFYITKLYMDEELPDELSDVGSDEIDYDVMDMIEEGEDTLYDIINFRDNYNAAIKSNITPPVLNKYEKTKVLSERTQQIEKGSPPYISNIGRFTTSYSIALEEFNQKKIPFIIRRPLPHLDGYEYWKLKDMIY